MAKLPCLSGAPAALYIFLILPLIFMTLKFVNRKVFPMDVAENVNMVLNIIWSVLQWTLIILFIAGYVQDCKGSINEYIPMEQELPLL